MPSMDQGGLVYLLNDEGKVWDLEVEDCCEVVLRWERVEV
jgi:hypothetical protein